MQAPGSTTGDQIDLKKVNGSLLYITCHEIITQMPTTFGPSDAVRATVTILDGDDKGTVLDDVLFFPKVLFRQLSKAVGSVDNVVLGRLGQGTVAKAGQDPPWILNPPTDADLAVGVKYEAYAAQRAQEQNDLF